MQLVPVDHDPFADEKPTAPKLVPVDHDPFAGEADAITAGRAGPTSAAVARGLVNGVPIVGPLAVGAADRLTAGIRALKHDTKYSEELKRVQQFDEATKAEHPWATTAAEIGAGMAATVPMVAAAPAVFGAGAGGLGARTAASMVSGGAIGAGDAAVRSDGEAHATTVGLGLGAGLGAAGPIAGKAVGAAVGRFTGGPRGEGALREALEGFSEKDLESAAHLIEQARNLPGGGVGLSLDEALNTVTGGQAARVSQLARVVANSGGEGGQTMNAFYAARPASVDNVGRAAFEGVAPQNLNPSSVGPEIQDAARAGVAQTAEGQAFGRSRAAQTPRITPEQAGQAIQADLGGVRDLREAARSSRANVDYRLAREAPETVGVERMITVERPGEPIVTRPEYSRPQFTDAAPRPLDPPPTVEASASVGPESLARFIARNGGLALDGDVLATDLHRFNVPGLGNVARQGGKSLDNHWREALIEAGYFRPDADGGAARDISSELLRKLQNEQRGLPSYPIGAERQAAAARSAPGQVMDEYRAALSDVESRLDDALTKVGVEPASIHPDIRGRVLGAMLRGEHAEPLDAYERTVNAMREAPRPYLKSTTVTEEVPDVRFGQVNPAPVVAAIDGLAQTAKGDIASALSRVRRDLHAPGGDTDMSVAGLHQARERLDRAIADAIEGGDGVMASRLQPVRQSLDAQLKTVPEMATADANFVRNSIPLEPFERGNAPLNRITARVDRPGAEPGAFRMPAEQVPETLSGPTALREALANGSPATRAAAERSVSTRILDRATGADGNVSAEALRTAMREHADVLDQLPSVRDRLSDLVVSREGLARIEASPLGRLSEQPEVKQAIRTLFPTNPAPGSQGEAATAMQALAANRPTAARDLTRIYLESAFNEATQQTKGTAAQYGGAGFASAVRGNAQQRHNLEAVVRALPEGETRWTGLDRMLTTLEATGWRPVKGSDTAFNTAIQERLKNGTGPIAAAITEAATNAVAGGGLAGPGGAVGGAMVGLKKAGGHAMADRKKALNGEAIARILTDPLALPDLRALVRSPPGSKNAELFTQRLLTFANGGAGPVRGSAASR